MTLLGQRPGLKAKAISQAGHDLHLHDKMKYLFLILMLAYSGCMIPYSVKVPPCHGTILDEKGYPISLAKVVISDYPDSECKTDKKGHFETIPTSYRQIFSFGDRVDHYNLIAEAEGFETSTNSVMVFRQDKIDVGPITLRKTE